MSKDPHEHQQTVQNQIIADLHAMSSKYDAKQLASLMFYYSVNTFRAVHSLGMWPAKEVEVFTTEVMKDLLVPLPADKLPRQAVLDKDGNVNPPTSQRLS